MFSGPDHSFTAATLLALVPCLLSWWSGTELARRLDDPVLPERFMAHQRRNAVLLAAGFAASAVVEPRALPWTAPLLFSTVVAAGYPVRRAIYGETWGLAAYLSFFHRLSIGVFGVWIVLGAMPALAAMAGRFDWIVGAITAGLVIVWDRRYSKVLRYLLRCRPLEDGPLLARCRQLATTSPLPEPLFLRADLNGGAVANALALPSLRGNAVLFTDTLLERLDEDEVVAICGHELAHFEYYDQARLQRTCRATAALAVAGATMTPASRLLGLDSIWTYLCWFGALLAVMAFRARDKQRQETVCDARAVELTGDPEPLVSGLTKLYAAARLPRRIAAPQDRAASHPSLSRRIRDIRRSAGVQPAALSEAVTIYGCDGSSIVSFEESSLSWQQDAGVTQVIDYRHLHELRLDIGRRGGPRLLAVSDRHRSWEMRVSAVDVPRLQAVLDSVDGRLGDAPAPRGPSLSFSRFLVAVLSLLALSIGQLTVAVVVLLASLRPARALVGGAAAAAFAAALLVVRDGPLTNGAPTAVLLGVAGAVLLTLAVIHRHQETRSVRLPVAALGVLAALLLVSIALAGLDPIRLHQSSRATPALPVLLVSIASALTWTKQRRTRLAAAALALLAVSAAVLSSRVFLDAFGRDPFLVEAPAISPETVEASPVDRFPLPESTSRVQLSPSGRFIAAQQDSEEEDDRSLTFHVGRLGDPLQVIAADTVRFVDDDTVLVGEDDHEGTTLRQIRLNSTHDVLWRQRIPSLRGAALGLSRDGRWHLEGWQDGETIVRAEGIVGAAEFVERRWPVADARDASINAVTTAGSQPLVVETRYDGGLLRHLPARAWMLGLLLHSGTERSRYWLAGDKTARPLGESRFGAHCPTGTTDGALLCSVFDGARTRLIRLDARDGSITAIGRLDGRFIAVDATADGWLTGWQDSTAVAVDLVNRRALRLPQSEGVAGGLSVSNGRLAAIVWDGTGATLRLYRLSEPEAFRMAARPVVR
jgi:Zn-dependent protease with chaperone function